MADRDDDAAPLSYSAPPPGVRRATAGMSCGLPNHAREFITANGSGELRRLESLWRCPTCGRGPVGSWNRPR